MDNMFEDLRAYQKQKEIAKDALLKIRRLLAINQFPPKPREAYFVAKKALKEIEKIGE